MVEAIYFAGLIIIPFVWIILYTIWPDIFIYGGDNYGGIGIVFFIAIWPALLLALCVGVVVFLVGGSFYLIARYIGLILKKALNNG